MRKLHTLILALVTLAACGQGNYAKQIGIKNMETKEVERQITMLYEKMYRLMIAKDVNSLGDILSDDFELVHMTGMHQPKAVYLKAIADGTLNYYKAETENLIFNNVSEDKVTITGQSRVNAAVFGGGKHTWPLQLKISLENKNGKWLMTRAVASTY